MGSKASSHDFTGTCVEKVGYATQSVFVPAICRSLMFYCLEPNFSSFLGGSIQQFRKF